MVRVAFVAAAVVLAGAGASAQTIPARVRVAPLDCATPPFAEESWRALLRTELESDGVEAVVFGGDESPAAAVIRVEIARCAEGATELAIAIDDALTRKSVRRVVDLGDVPASGRPRALALAVAELLRASWAELAMAPTPPPDAPAPTPPPAVRRAVVVRLVAALERDGSARAPERPRVERPAPRWSLGATFALQSFPAANAALLGGRAFVTLIPTHRWPLRLRLDAGAATGTSFDPLGEIDLGLATAALAATIFGGSDRFALELGPRVELGWSWVEGRPSAPGVRGSSGDAAVFFASVLATVRVRVAGRWWATLDAVAGTSLRPVTITSGTARAAGFTGPTLSFGLGVAVAL